MSIYVASRCSRAADIAFALESRGWSIETWSYNPEWGSDVVCAKQKHQDGGTQYCTVYVGPDRFSVVTPEGETLEVELSKFATKKMLAGFLKTRMLRERF